MFYSEGFWDVRALLVRHTEFMKDVVVACYFEPMFISETEYYFEI